MTDKKGEIRIIEGPFTGVIENPALTFPYPPDHFQNHSFVCIDRGEHVLVLAHTGSGKTAPALYAIARHLRLGNKIIYTAPIKALSNQKYAELIQKFEVEFSQLLGRSIQVGIMTGDYKIKPTADVVIMTTEILANSLLKIQNRENSIFDEDFMDRLGCVIFDEVHYINNKERGPVWEKTIVLLDPKVQLVMLSATIERPERLAQIVANKSNGVPINMIPTSHRVVPLEHFIFVDERLYKILDRNENFQDQPFDDARKVYQELEKKKKGNSKEHRMNQMVNYLKKKNLLQAIIFCFSKANCEKFAKMLTCNLVESEEASQIHKIFDHQIHKIFGIKPTLKDDPVFMAEYDLMQKLLPRGIAFHHAGVAQTFREIIEIIFSKGLIKVLFATETFAVGVNMPTRTVVFTEVEKHDGSKRRFVETGEYKQMAGRAGRRGIDERGNVIILPLYDFPEKQEMKTVMLGRLPAVRSHFEITYSFILQIIQSQSTTVQKFVDISLFQMDHNDLLKQIDQDIADLEAKVDSYEFTEEQIAKMDKYLEADQEEENFKKIGVQLNKAQKKKREELKRELKSSPNLSKLYQRYVNYKKEVEKLNSLKKERDETNNYILMESDRRLQVLRKEDYLAGNEKTIFELGPQDILPKGVVASKIDSCNPLLLAEILVSDIFDGLLPEEIIAVLGIFIDDIKNDDRKMLKEIECSDAVYDRLVLIQNIIDRYTKQEKGLGIQPHSTEEWELYYDYVDFAFLWASGYPIQEIKQMGLRFNIQVDTGNFERAIKKLNNLVDNLIGLCPICGKEQYIPVLEKIKELVTRDVVDIPSLYVM